jgi:hypothetical protein
MWFAISEAGMDPVSRLTNTLLAGGRSDPDGFIAALQSPGQR